MASADDSHQPRATIEDIAEIVSITFFGLPRMHPHAHPQLHRLGPRLTLKGSLTLDRRTDGLTGPSEGGGKAVATSREDEAAVGVDHLPQQSVMARQRRSHHLACLLPKCR
jgi:hypothetical protein